MNCPYKYLSMESKRSQGVGIKVFQAVKLPSCQTKPDKPRGNPAHPAENSQTGQFHVYGYPRTEGRLTVPRITFAVYSLVA